MISQFKNNTPKTSPLEQQLLLAHIQETETLPLPPCSVMELNRILKMEPDNRAAIIDCFLHDHVLMALLFRIFYKSYPGVNPASPMGAADMIPLERIRTLMDDPAQMEEFTDDEVLEWNHAYSCRILMESILEDNEIYNPELVRAALFHDIGKTLFREWSAKKCRDVKDHAENNRIRIHQAEKAILQMDHAEAGAELLRAWGFSEAVWKVVAQHHNTGDDLPESYRFETALLQFVNYIDCKVRGIPCDPPSARLMKAARIAEIDEEGYTGSQKALLERLKANDNEAIRVRILEQYRAIEKQIREERARKAAEELAAKKAAEEEAKRKAEPEKQEHGIAFSSRFRTASLSISSGNGFAPVAPATPVAPAEPEESLASALSDDDDVLKNPDFDPEQYSSEAVPASTAKREEELLRKMGLK